MAPTTLAPRQAQEGQQLLYTDTAGNQQRLEAEQVDERWVLRPRTAGDELAMNRYGMAIDEDLVAEEEAKSQLAGEALDKRAAELDIEGRSTMSADQKRVAVAAAEVAADAGPEAPTDNDTTTTNQDDGAPSQEE